MSKQKTGAAINQLSKALLKCAGVGLKLQPVPCPQLTKGDWIVHEGTLQRLTAKDARDPATVALYPLGEIVKLTASQAYLALRV